MLDGFIEPWLRRLRPDIRPHVEDIARWSLRSHIELVSFEIQFWHLYVIRVQGREISSAYTVVFWGVGASGVGWDAAWCSAWHSSRRSL